MDQASHTNFQGTRVIVNPGVCGFNCTVYAEKSSSRKVRVTIPDSECEQVNKMSQWFEEISLADIFKPFTRNPFFKWAELAGCHTTCLVPTAISKAVEVEMGMAVPRKAELEFGSDDQRNDGGNC